MALKGDDGDDDFLDFACCFEEAAPSAPQAQPPPPVMASALQQDEAAMTLCILSDTHGAEGEIDLVNGFCNLLPQADLASGRAPPPWRRPGPGQSHRTQQLPPPVMAPALQQDAAAMAVDRFLQPPPPGGDSLGRSTTSVASTRARPRSQATAGNLWPLRSERAS